MLLSMVTFASAALLLIVLPGPDTLVVLRNLVRGGRPQGLRTAAGSLTGLLVWMLVAVLGLSATLRASHDAYLALRLVGAGYLVWMGVQALRNQRAGAIEKPRRPLLGHGYPAGLTTNLLNPKVGVFFVTFLPGFVPAGASVPLTSLLLGGIYLVETALYLAVLLTLSGVMVRWLQTERIRRRMDRTMGAVFLGFGLRLALET